VVVVGNTITVGSVAVLIMPLLETEARLVIVDGERLPETFTAIVMLG
jgi:hypothetical protein